MICQHCHENPAQVQYTEVVGGEKKVEWLCTGCAKQRGITVHIGATAKPPLSSVLPKKSLGEGASALHCSRCGLRLEAFRESGRVGCPDCYEVFREVIDPLLRRVHHSTEHAPSEGGQDAESRLRRVLGTLRRELTEAVGREEFERAASLRDEIRRYEEESRDLGTSSSSAPDSRLPGDGEADGGEGET